MTRCTATSAGVVCDRDAGHGGLHRGYLDTVDTVVFWKGKAMHCPTCGVETGLPPYTCGNCGTVVRPCPHCAGTGVVTGNGR